MGLTEDTPNRLVLPAIMSSPCREPPIVNLGDPILPGVPHVRQFLAVAITKRTFLATLECRTMGWRAHHEGDADITPGLAWRYFEGNQVQRLAREWLGPGQLLPSGATQVAIDATSRAVADPSSTLLFEATFSHEGCVARADALRRVPGGWELVEVKAGTFKPDEKIKPEYLDDVAYTCAVALASGLPLAAASLVLVNSEFVAGGDLPLLVSADLTVAALDRASVLREHLTDIALVIGGGRPEPTMIFHCKKCDHFAVDCVGHDIPDPLFDIPRLSQVRFDEFAPYRRISALPPDARLTPIQSAFVAVARSGVPAVDHAVLARLDEVAWPLYYLDFEAIAPAVPRFPGTRPYQKHPFQFSLHVRQREGGADEHHEYLAPIDTDWRRELVEKLLELLGDRGSIMVYSNYEEQVLKQLASWFPDLESRLAPVIARLFDLEKVVKQGYVHPEFRGRTSIKKVLPVMSPSLDYEGMAVSGGEDAAAVFGFMWLGEYPPEDHPEHRDHLLGYCKRDTEAMVHVHEGLERVRNA